MTRLVLVNKGLVEEETNCVGFCVLKVVQEESRQQSSDSMQAVI